MVWMVEGYQEGKTKRTSRDKAGPPWRPLGEPVGTGTRCQATEPAALPPPSTPPAGARSGPVSQRLGVAAPVSSANVQLPGDQAGPSPPERRFHARAGPDTRPHRAHIHLHCRPLN